MSDIKTLNTKALSSHLSSSYLELQLPIFIVLAHFLDPNMGKNLDRAEASQVSCIFARGRQAHRTVATIDFGLSS